MSSDAMRPLATTPAGSTARLGASLHVKGEISGNEDLHVDGSVEGSDPARGPEADRRRERQS